jgi:hypothetical protein
MCAKLTTNMSREQRLFRLAEQIMNWSGVPVVHVRPTVLLDNPLFTVCCDGRHQGGWHRTSATSA